MKRSAYKPPTGKYSIVVAIVGGLACTALLFLAVPLSQKLSEFMSPTPEPLPEIEDTPPPPEFVEDTPPEEVEEPEPEPDDFVNQPMDLDLGLEVADIPTGFGNGLDLSISNFALAGDDGPGAGGALDQPPKPVRKPQPVYPQSLLKRKIGGRVQVACVVSDKGDVTSASVRTSSGQSKLDEAAVKAARRWKFKPAIVAGRPSKGSVVIPFNFEVRG